jgi:excisionase family DNA binding protein
MDPKHPSANSIDRSKTESCRRTLSVEEAARMLGLGVRATRRAIRAGKIQAIRVGRRWLVLREPFEKMLRGAGSKGADR